MGLDCGWIRTLGAKREGNLNQIVVREESTSAMIDIIFVKFRMDYGEY